MSSPQNVDAPKGKRPPGRPRREDAPNVPWQLVDQALVFGERFKDPKTGHEIIRYPSQKELADRYGVSQTRVWQYVDRHKCYERRAEAQLRVQARYEDKLVEAQATERAL